MPKVKNQIFKYSDGFPIVGWCLYWSIRKVSIPFNELQDLLKELSIDQRLAKKPLHRNAFIKSVKEMSKLKDNNFHRKVADSTEKMALVMVNQNVDDKNLKVDFKTKTTAVFDKISKNLEIKGHGGSEIEDKYQFHQEHYDSKQLRSLVLRYVKQICDGVTVRQDGGVYFVATEKEEELDKLEKLFERINSINSESILEIIPIIDSKKARNSIWKSVVGDINNNLDKLLEDFNNMNPDINARNLKLKLKKYDNLKTKVEMYEEVLKDTADGLKDKIKSINDKVIEKLDKLENDNQ